MPVVASVTSPTDPRGGQPATLSGLVLVSTPIGNLGDLSARARSTLELCNLVLCEDTRRTAKLLSALGLRVRTAPFHDHNEDSRIPVVLDLLRDGKMIGLVSDAGTPLISDPGYRLVRAAISSGIPVTAVPGPVAAVTALILSGLPPLPFMFLGFPPPKKTARQGSFGGLRAAERAGLRATLIWHEAPHRLVETLIDLRSVFGNRAGAVARELTKRFETIERGRLAELAACFERQAPRGEITLLIGPPENEDPENLDQRLRNALVSHTVKDAAVLVSVATGLPRKLVYARALELAEKI